MNRFARHLKGSHYTLDPKVTSRALIGLAWRRSLLLTRGLLFAQRIIFIGKGVQLWNRRYLTVGRGVTLQDGVCIDALSENGVRLGDNCNIGPMTIIQATGILTHLGVGLSMGSNSGIGGFSFIGCGGGVAIGANVIMGQYVSFHSENHVFCDVNIPIRLQGVTRDGIEVGDDCWIGAKATFLDGAKVGRGCVIAAGSVVRGNFPPFSVIAGVPARIVKSRLATNPAIPPIEASKCV